MAHPDVRDVAVIGIPDDFWGEAVCALIVPREGVRLDEAAIVSWAGEHLAGYKKPKKVVPVREIARTPSGKILKRELREKFWRGRERRV